MFGQFCLIHSRPANSQPFLAEHKRQRLSFHQHLLCTPEQHISHLNHNSHFNTTLQRPCGQATRPSGAFNIIHYTRCEPTLKCCLVFTLPCYGFYIQPNTTIVSNLSTLIIPLKLIKNLHYTQLSTIQGLGGRSILEHAFDNYLQACFRANRRLSTIVGQYLRQSIPNTNSYQRCARQRSDSGTPPKASGSRGVAGKRHIPN